MYQFYLLAFPPIAKRLIGVLALICLLRGATPQPLHAQGCLAESEPNNEATSAQAVAAAFCIEGDLEGSADWFRWRIDEAESQQRWNLQLTLPAGSKPNLQLYNAESQAAFSVSAPESGNLELAGLGLAPGEYLVAVAPGQKKPLAYALQVTADGTRSATLEEEPNDGFQFGYRIASATAIRGLSTAGRDPDYYRFTSDADFVSKRWSLVLKPASRAIYEMCLLDGEGAQIQCHQSNLPALADMVLPLGEYGISVQNLDQGRMEYSVELVETGLNTPESEAEPNDRIRYASLIGESGRVHGHSMGEESDYYRLPVTGSAQRYRVEVIGEGLQHIALHDSGDVELQRRDAAGGRVARMENLYLLPGTHYFRVKGMAGDYSIQATALGEPARSADASLPIAEREPNDLDTQSLVLPFDRLLSGMLAEIEDVDSYRFYLPAESQVLLTVTPGADAVIITDLAGVVKDGQNQPGQPYIYQALLAAGDYAIQLRPELPNEAPYTIQLAWLNRFDLPVDSEPINNAPNPNSIVPPSMILEGQVGGRADADDWYRLPLGQEAQALQIQPEGEGINLSFFVGEQRFDKIKWKAREKVYTGALPTEGRDDFYVRVRANGTYRLSFVLEGGPVPLPLQPLPIEFGLVNSDQALAAFWQTAQRLDSTLLLTNTSAVEQSLQLAIASSDDGWTPTLKQNSLTIPAGGHLSIPLRIDVTADASANDVYLSLLATNANGERASADWSLAALCGAAPLNPNQAWTSAGALVGGLNVAWSAFGAAPVGEKSAAEEERALQLLDGMVSPNNGWRTTLKQPAVTIDLAGDAPLMIRGVLLNPQGRIAAPFTLRRFQVLTSLDGEEFVPALEAELSPLAVEQAFLLPTAVEARFVRLLVQSNHDPRNEREIGLGEFKVIAAPETQLEPAGFNLADPAKGGHLVYSSPVVDSALSMLTDVADSEAVVRKDEKQAEWVIGFQHNRAAQISALHWVNAAGESALNLTNIEVWVSAESPVGPWQSLGEWLLDAASSETQVKPLDAPVWARYVRFVAPFSDQSAAEGQAYLAYPETIRIVERAVDDSEQGTYRSILAEWGHYRKEAIYEQQQAITALAPQVAETGGGVNADQSRPLLAGQPAAGVVASNGQEAWYQFAVAEGDNALEIALSGDPVTLDLLDATGASVDYAITAAGGGKLRLIAEVVPGIYKLGVSNPQHSVAFAWDTSGSVGPYLNTMYRALATFMQHVDPQVDPQSEVANLLPFGEPGQFLLSAWSSDPATLQSALTNYARGDNSSAVEANLQTTVEALGQRAGARSVILMTDAKSNSYAQTATLWQTLSQVRPRIFSFELGVADSATSQDLMQDWADINQGYYDSMTNLRQFETGFERATCMLRRPARYWLQASSYQLDAVALLTAVGAEPTPTAEPVAAPAVAEVPAVAEAPAVAPTPTPATLFAAAATPTPAPTATPLPTEMPEPTPTVNAPAFLSVVGTTNDGAYTAPIRNGAIEIILDASGSMLQTLDGRYRIDIARDVLNDLAYNVLEPGVPLAMRVFGHREARSCRTDLEVPLGPLVPDAVASFVLSIQTQDFSKTAIADSLRLVPQDMASARGAKVVVLVTDGEETCGGDPAAVIENLMAQNLDIRVNIVGFAVDDPGVREKFIQWAKLGNGFYFEAANAEELSEAIDRALQVPFRAYALESGDLVASGVANAGRVEVPPGVYKVVVETDPPLQFERVVIPGGESVELTVQAPE